MISVLLIAGIFPPEIGGPATFIDHLARELSQLGYKVTVVCNSVVPGEEPSDKLRPFRVIRVYSRLWAIQIYKMIPILAWYMLWHDVALVNGMEYSSYWASRITGRRYLLKIVGDTAWEEARGSGSTALGIDDFQKEDNIDGRVKRLRDWRQKYLNAAYEVIVPSEYLKRLVTAWGFSQERIRVIYNGVAIQSGMDTSMTEKQPIDKSMKVVFVGRLTNWKGVETLLLAAQKIEDLEVHIHGHGPEYPLLVNLAEQLRITSKVQFHGNLGHEALMRFMKKMDVLVLGSSYEGLSHTLIEACSIGLPCIASDSGGNPEVIRHNENGLLYPYGDVAALTDGLKLLQKNESLRFKMAIRAREIAADFDFKKTIDETIRALLDSK